MSKELMIKVDNVYKKYRLGTIGGGTLTGDLQSWWAKVRHKEDPNSQIGATQHDKNEIFYALKGISFEIEKGEAVGIIGGNGAGKSTTLKLLSQVTAPTSGKIYLNGRIASMLEVGTGFHPELTGRENIYLNGAILGMKKDEIDANMEDIIEFSECRQFIDTPVKRYSSGMYVKLAFSVAAHLDSEIMIMDEVLAVGDMKFQQKCIEKMLSIVKNEGRTILYVSHNMNTIRQLCDRCIVLENGKVIFEGDNDTAIQKYMNSYSLLREKIDFSKIKRDDWLGIELKCKMLRCLVKNQKCIVSENDRLSIELTWENLKRIDELYLRIQFKYMGESIATSFLNQAIKCDSVGVFSKSFEIDIKNLLPGTYDTVLVLYEIGSDGSSFDVDCVNGFSFEYRTDDKLKAHWNFQRWGKCAANEIMIVEDNK